MSTRYRHVIGNPIMGLGSYARLRVPRTTVQGGGNNGARTFNGSNQSFSAADNADLSFGDDMFTIMARVNPTDFDSTMAVFSKGTPGSAGGEYSLTIAATTGVPTFSVRNLANAAAVSVMGTALTAATWANVECYHDITANVIGIRVNNEPATTSALAGGIFDGVNDFQIGAQAAGSYFHGSISNVALWGRRLTAVETHWWVTSPRRTADMNQPGDEGASIQTDLISHWMMRESNGDALDTFNGNQLAANNSPGSTTGQGTVVDYWTLRDTVGLNHATVEGVSDPTTTRSTDVPSVLTGHSYSLGGTDDRAAVYSKILCGNADKSVACWVKYAAKDGAPFGNNDLNVGYIFLWYSGDDNLYVGCETAGNQWAWNAATHGLTLNTWYHIAVSFDLSENTAELFVNGVSKGIPGTPILKLLTDIEYLGWGEATYYLNGKMALAQVYSGKLSAAQCLELTAGNAATGATLLHEYAFSEGA